MALFFYIILPLACLTGFALFSRAYLKPGAASAPCASKISVIIPARNEEHNLPHLLGSLQQQTLMPGEIIVVDDSSTDGTSRVARQYEGVTVIRNPALPDGWTGKTWAVWNGYRHATGDLLVFLDADVRLDARALELLVAARERSGGAISVVPYHHTERFYERLSLIPYLLGVFSFVSPFERIRARNLYGSCIVATREDYDRIGGHHSIRGELLDDLNLGKKFDEAGIRVENFLGNGYVRFRMYPYGLLSEMHGFSKGAVLSTATLQPATIALIAIWLAGLLAVEFMLPVLIVLRSPLVWPFVAGYALYTLQILYFLRYTGRYRWLIPAVHILSSIFFLVVMAYSAYQVVCVGTVSWKGRQVAVRGGERGGR